MGYVAQCIHPYVSKESLLATAGFTGSITVLG